MKRNIMYVLTIMTLAGVMVGFATLSFAQPGSGYGRHWQQTDEGDAAGYQTGWRGQSYAQGYCFSELSDEQRKKLDEERKAFHSATQDLRQEIYHRHLLLRAELAAKNSDQKKASALQTELSGLEADLDQKRLAHWFKIKDIAPDFDARCLGSGHKGHGRRGGSAW